VAAPDFKAKAISLVLAGDVVKAKKPAPDIFLEAGRRIGVPTEDVLIEGCTVYHAHGGFTIGSEMSGGVRNVFFENCKPILKGNV